ncbi:MAG: Flavoredoxin [Candidatus Omnitrophica bacterium ADurb.Bin277]|nr:MAG: Flavoredoxin [Candidatus Omnitrophica bacterium ADurb.Bin277]
MTKKPFPLDKVYTLIEPGPILMVTTRFGNRPNIMTMSWHTMIDFLPPLVGLVIGDQSHTFRALKATGECVINIPTAPLIKKAVRCGNVSGRSVDKFKAFRLTPVKAAEVKAPMIGECCASLECRTVDQGMAERYNLFILEVVKAWADSRIKNPRMIHHRGKDLFAISGKTLRIASGMK